MVLGMLSASVLSGWVLSVGTRGFGEEAGAAIVLVAVMAGVLSGSRGGPLLVDRPVLVHELLPAVDRDGLLRSRFRALVRRGWLAGIGLGALALGASWGELGSDAPAVAAAVGLLVAVTWHLYAATAGMSSGHRPHRALAIGACAASLLVASALATVPARPHPAAFLVAGAVLVAGGLAGHQRVALASFEKLAHRSAALASMAFAAMRRDVRTLMLVHRQLVGDGPRTGRRLRFVGLVPGVVLRRYVTSICRWRAYRWCQAAMAFAALVFGALALHWQWTVAPLLLVVSGWFAAFLVAEPLAQDTDHPTLAHGMPHQRRLAASHVASIVLLVAVAWAAVAGACALVIGGGAAAHLFGRLVLFPVAATAGAVVTLCRLPSQLDVAVSFAPEVAGSFVIVREALPFIVVAGGLPGSKTPMFVSVVIAGVLAAVAYGFALRPYRR